jgi:hypothetical protein
MPHGNVGQLHIAACLLHTPFHAHCCTLYTVAYMHCRVRATVYTVAYMHCRTWPRTLPDTTARTAAHCCTTAHTLPRTAPPFSCCASLIHVLMLVHGYVQSKALPLLLCTCAVRGRAVCGSAARTLPHYRKLLLTTAHIVTHDCIACTLLFVQTEYCRLHNNRTLCCAAAHCRSLALLQTAALPHITALSHTAARNVHTAERTACHTLPHCCSLPHCRTSSHGLSRASSTLPPHYRTLLQVLHCHPGHCRPNCCCTLCRSDDQLLHCRARAPL